MLAIANVYGYIKRGARDRTRTGTILRSGDFKSSSLSFINFYAVLPSFIFQYVTVYLSPVSHIGFDLTCYIFAT